MPIDSLTVSLAAVGAVVLGGMVAHGAWQARRAGPRRAAPAPIAPHEMREPTLDIVNEPTQSLQPVDAAGEREEPQLHIRKPAAPPRIDALIDVVVPIAVEQPLNGDAALAHLPGSRRAGSKPLAIEGLNADTGEWELPAAGARYGEFQAGLQLANRAGAMNEIEYSEFVQKVQAFADGIGASCEFPDMLDAVARARELDGFAGQHDAQLALRLRARSTAWSIGYLQQNAARHGFVPGAVAGRLVLPSQEDNAPPVLTLTFDSQAALADDPNAAAVRELTLSFDVPQTDAAVEPFAAWHSSAAALARDKDPENDDDQGQPLGIAGFHAIHKELGQLYESLAARDVTAGSMVARRLFS